MTDQLRVLVADDQTLVRDGFCVILDAQPDMTVVGEAGNGEEAVRAALELRPHVVLMDVRMPVMNGIAATAEICAATDARVLMLTTFDLDEHVYDAPRAGASGFLLKDMRRADLVNAVRTIAAGESLLAPSVTRRLITDMIDRNPPASRTARSLTSLTARETETLRLVAKGLSNVEVATALHVSENTVKTHVSNMLSKLNLRDRVQAVIAAYESGLVVPRHHPQG